MRLKNFSAPTMAKAMALVRAELGEDAVIVSNHVRSDGQGVEVIAAIEPRSEVEVASLPDEEAALCADELDVLQDVLDYHRAPARLIEKLYSAARVLETGNPLTALAGALDAGFGFAPLPTTQSPRPIMLVGPPGAGKTATLAKLAARAIMSGQPAALITTDTVHTGAAEQFASYAGLLRMKSWTASDAPSLRAALDAANGAPLKLVDTTGANPFDAGDLARLADFAGASDAEPVLVLPAGMDPSEAAETAEAFLPIGIKRLVTTRIDTARRLGGLLAAGEAANLQLSEAGTGPQIADGLRPLNPLALARVLAATPADRVSTLSAS
jgi:flagellar biosynthesis protein FlhF